MKALDPAFQSHLQSGTTTLCHCWRLTLKSGEKLGFTDHDEAVFFDGTSFEAQAGFTASEIESTTGLTVDNLEASGALSSAQLNEARIKAGDYDHAQIEVWLVNWQAPAQRTLQRKGHLGEITYGQGHFTAEVRGLAHLLNQPKGRLYQHGCDALLGDARCGLNLNATTYSVNGSITALGELSVDVSGASSFASGFFARGILRFTSGANAGRQVEILRHRLNGALATVEFTSLPRFAIGVGDSVILQAGCDKQFATCKTKFNNAVNFRGFPTMPGSDFVLAIAQSGR